MKKIILDVVMLGMMVLAWMPVYGQGHSPDEEAVPSATPSIKYPTTGVRFVICTTTNERLPVPLYAEYNEGYVPLRISARGPSERAEVKGGHVLLYEKVPVKDKKGEKKEVPYLDVEVPAEMRGDKVICVVLLAKGAKKPVYYFIKEEDFPVGGVYVVNFSPSVLEMWYTFNGDMPKKPEMIRPFVRPENNCLRPDAPNIWKYAMKEHPGVKDIQYVLRKPADVEGGTPMPLKSSRFIPKRYNAIMVIVVRHPKIDYAFQLVSFVYNNEAERLQKETEAGEEARRAGEEK